MAGAGRRTFTPGEVLTASNVMNYLQDQAVMNFAGTAARGSAIGTAVSEGMVSYLADNNFLQAHDGAAWRSIGGVQVASGTAARDALLPSPVQGDKVFRTDLGFEQTYYTAAGTANPGGRASAGWYDNQRNMGLVPIVPPTVNVSGGTATANTLGSVSFTNASSISFNNVFTSTYDNYRIFINLYSTSVTTDIIFRVRASGTDLSSSTYQYSKGSMLSNVYGADFQSSSTGINFARSGGTGGSLSTLDIAAPALSQYTKLVGMFAQGTSLWFGSLYANVGNTTSYDGFTVYPASGGVTFTGTIQVLGYNS